jgi:hypothetical protein
MAFSSRSFDYSSDRLIPCIVLDGPPTEKTDGAIGVLCIDKENGNLYKCVSANYSDRVFTWRIVGDVSDDQIRQSVSDYLEQHPASGGGITVTAADLLITILQNAVFTSNQTGNIAALREALASSGGSGGDTPDNPDTPDEPDEPVVTDIITVTDGIMTIVAVGSEITVSDGAMTIA